MFQDKPNFFNSVKNKTVNTIATAHPGFESMDHTYCVYFKYEICCGPDTEIYSKSKPKLERFPKHRQKLSTVSWQKIDFPKLKTSKTTQFQFLTDILCLSQAE